MEIRPFAAQDDLALGELLHDPATPADLVARGLLRPDQDSPVLRSVAAVIDDTDDPAAAGSGVVVGAAVLAEAPVHPTRAWAHVEVADTERRRGVGRRLLAGARAHAAGTPLAGLPLRARVAAGSTGDEVLRHLGAAELFRTRVIRVEPGTLAGLGHGREEDFAVTTTGSVVLTQLFGEWYAGVNRKDPAAEMSVGEVNRRFLSEATGAHGAAMLRRDGGVSGFAVSYARPVSEEQVEQIEEAGEEYPATELTLASLYDARVADVTTIDRESAEYQAALGDAAVLVASLSLETPVEIEVTSEMPVVTELLDGLVSAGQARVLYEYVTYGPE
ncbi:histone acetyltransferase [Brevibacterium litoralis]|uniref:histone acetyltransferase n=1 Tax=Brevibacterium litoralis TaxID=3138935 RepID=UPI0032EE66D1